MLPPSGEMGGAELAALRRELDELTEDRAGEVTRLRVLEPDDGLFVEDVAVLLAEDGADLVCVLGREAANVVQALADRYPATRFCASPAIVAEPPDNVDPVVLATDELGHAVGAAAAVLAGEDGTVAVVVGGSRVSREALLAGLEAGLARVEVPLSLVVGDEGEARRAARRVGDAEVDVVVVDLPQDDAEAFLGRLGRAGPHLFAGPAVAAQLGDETPTVAWMPRWSAVVASAIERLLDAGEPVPRSLGFAGDAFEVRVGDDLTPEAAAALARAIEGLRRGDRDATSPPPRSEARAPEGGPAGGTPDTSDDTVPAEGAPE